MGRRPGLLLALLRRQAALGLVAIAGVDAIDGDVLALDEGEEVAPGRFDLAAGGLAQHHWLAAPGDALHGLEA